MPDHDRVWRYRTHLRRIPRVMGGGSLGLIAAALAWLVLVAPWAWEWAGAAAAATGGGGVPGARTLLYWTIWVGPPVASAAFAVELGIFWLLMRRFARTEVRLCEGWIEYRDHRRTVQIPYDEVRELSFANVRIGGWMKIAGPNETVRLTVVLDGLPDFLTELRRRLDARVEPLRYDAQRLGRFFAMAVGADHGFDRVYERWRLGLGLALCFGAATAAVLALAAAPAWALAVAAVAGPFWYWTAVSVGELVLGLRDGRRVDRERLIRPERDRALERRIYRWTVLGAALIAAVALAAMVALLPRSS